MTNSLHKLIQYHWHLGNPNVVYGCPPKGSSSSPYWPPTIVLPSKEQWRIVVLFHEKSLPTSIELSIILGKMSDQKTGRFLMWKMKIDDTSTKKLWLYRIISSMWYDIYYCHVTTQPVLWNLFGISLAQNFERFES